MRPKIERSEREDGPARVKVTQVSITLGNWPSEPGAHGFVEARGTWKKKAKTSDPIWRLSWDDSDNPYKGGWTGESSEFTYAEAKTRLLARLQYLTERRSTLFDSEGRFTGYDPDR